jgi:uncharacterized protein YegJ (DUF2314 family)
MFMEPTMRFTRCALLLLSLLLAALPARAQERPSQLRSDIYWVQDDAPIDSAAERARETLPVFRRWLPRAAEGEVVAQLKARFEFGDEIEHMWISDVRFKGGAYHGRLASTPMADTDLGPGDAVTIRADEVTDWMVVLDDVVLGAFTVIEIRRRMDPKQRREFDEESGYRIPDEAVLEPPR